MSNYSWNEILMAIGAMGVVSFFLLSTLTAIMRGKPSGLLESFVYGASNNLLQKRLFAWGYILSWGMFVSGLIAGLIVT